MLISILILTHKRPELFKRCINSVLKNKPSWAEIIVNNDSNDIEEIDGAIYHYKKDDNLSNIYNFLIHSSKGKYIFFLEDDDYVTPNFWDIIEKDLKEDKTLVYNYIPHNGIKEYFNRFKGKIENGVYRKDEFLKLISKEHFQLSQMVFRKSDITMYMKDNYLDNDWKLFIGINNNIYYNEIPIFIQTTDGNDNISFEKYNRDIRFKGQH